jgi:hypothetical protein
LRIERNNKLSQGEPDSAEAVDLDAASTGMGMLLRLTLDAMKSGPTSVGDLIAVPTEKKTVREEQPGGAPATASSGILRTEEIGAEATEMPRSAIERDGLDHVLPFSCPRPQGIGKIQAAGLGIQTDRINLGAREPLAGAGAAGL